MVDSKFLSLRLPFALWYIFCLLIWALYSGTLTAVLAIPSYEKPIDSLDDLPRAVKEGFTIGAVRQTMIEYLLKDATEGIYKQTWNLLRLKDPSETLVENPVIGFNKILLSKFIFLAPTAVSVVAAATRGKENFHLGRHTFYPINYGIACPTGSPMKDKFSQLQARMVEGGLIYKWEDDEFYKVLKRADGNESNTPPAISLIHLQAAFFLLVIGYVSAAVVLMAENINDCWNHREEKRSY
ncbi:glutamate receptor ionotropic, kainate 2-like [Macrobrachium nipponense]|uniref:glutamate receptor ionotropic, kainate 2-like n=1 Tax=Macrobrachium nipponense TaxID=159736 RepID=UPI0030C7A1A0